MNFTLRRALPEDGPVLEEIERECFPDPSWDAEEFQHHQTTVAEFEGRIIGFLVMHRVFEGDARQAGEYEILNLAVVPVSRGLGVGKALIENGIPSGCPCFLEVRVSNGAARNLYKKLGFIEVGSRVDYYENPPEDAIVMVRK